MDTEEKVSFLFVCLLIIIMGMFIVLNDKNFKIVLFFPMLISLIKEENKTLSMITSIKIIPSRIASVFHVEKNKSTCTICVFYFVTSTISCAIFSLCIILVSYLAGHQSWM